MKNIFTNQLHIFFLALLLNLNTQQVNGQYSQLCFQYFFPTVEAQAGDQVTLPMRVRGFDFVAAIQFGVYFDSTDLELIAVEIDSAALPGFGAMSHNLVMPGLLLVAWSSDNGMGVSLPDSTVILELKFQVKANATGFLALKIGDLGPYSPFEAAQMLPPDWRVVYLPLGQKVGGVSIGSTMPDILTATKTCANATTCNGSNGAASIEITGGQPPYSYQWEGPGGFTASDTAYISGLTAGDYWVTVTDQLNNSVVLNIRVGASFATIESTLQVTQASSCNIHNGCANITVNNGQAPYTYAWSTGLSTGATNCNLPPGQFQVTVTDAVGCSLVRTSQVGSIIDLTLNLTYQHINSCSSLGSAEVNPVGINDFQYRWSTGDTTRAISGLAAGVYTVWVTEAGICETMQTFEILEQIPTFNLHLSVTNVQSCNGTGSATINPDGMPPFQYLWSTGATSSSVSELAIGNYGVTVTSADGCVASQLFNVYKDYNLGWSIDSYKQCNPSDPNTGTLYLYYYSFEDEVPAPSLVTWSNGVVHHPDNPGEFGYFDSLVGAPSGIYSVTVTDTEGCTISKICWLDCAKLQVPDWGVPAFYVKDDYLDTHYSIDSCIGVYAQNFEGIQSLSFSLGWQNGAQFANVRNFNLPGLDLSDFDFSVGINRLGLNWESLNPITLPPHSCLFEVCMTPTTSWIAHRTIEFIDKPVDVKLIGESGQEEAFVGKGGEILFNLYFPLQPSTIEAGVMPPDCSTDGNSQLCIKQSNPTLDIGMWIYKLNANTSGYFFWGNAGSAQRLSAGKYTVQVTQNASESEKYFLKIPSNNEANNCVWPGDTDNNNVVNHYDLLFIGMAYGTTGHARPDASLEWLGQDALDWDHNSTLMNVNFKNADTNGDGAINTTDAEAILQNWGHVINSSKDHPFAGPTNTDNNVQETAICLSKDTLEQGRGAILPILIGSANAVQDSAYGLAFSVGYDPNVFKGGMHFVQTDSWLGNVSDLLVLQKNDTAQGVIYVGITRMDGTPSIGWGAIGGLSVQVADDILEDATNNLKTSVYFNGINAVNAKELTKRLGGPPTEIIIRRQTSPVEEVPGWEKQLAIYPNPAHSLLNIASPEALLSGIEISDLMGRVVLSKQLDAAFFQVPVHEMAPGVYVVRAFTKNGVCSKKIVISH
ncbi:MAG: T9SS type A sorting domain-containing protein [Saprospiraceae bacterium]|nr:T9SS type A sorting domain-containing protein [Saprospiraceae bacterium]